MSTDLEARLREAFRAQRELPMTDIDDLYAAAHRRAGDVTTRRRTFGLVAAAAATVATIALPLALRGPAGPVPPASTTSARPTGPTTSADPFTPSDVTRFGGRLWVLDPDLGEDPRGFSQDVFLGYESGSQRTTISITSFPCRGGFGAIVGSTGALTRTSWSAGACSAASRSEQQLLTLLRDARGLRIDSGNVLELLGAQGKQLVTFAHQPPTRTAIGSAAAGPAPAIGTTSTWSVQQVRWWSPARQPAAADGVDLRVSVTGPQAYRLRVEGVCKNSDVTVLSANGYIATRSDIPVRSQCTTTSSATQAAVAEAMGIARFIRFTDDGRLLLLDGEDSVLLDMVATAP